MMAITAPATIKPITIPADGELVSGAGEAAVTSGRVVVPLKQKDLISFSRVSANLYCDYLKLFSPFFLWLVPSSCFVCLVGR